MLNSLLPRKSIKKSLWWAKDSLRTRYPHHSSIAIISKLRKNRCSISGRVQNNFRQTQLSRWWKHRIVINISMNFEISCQRAMKKWYGDTQILIKQKDQLNLTTTLWTVLVNLNQKNWGISWTHIPKWHLILSIDVQHSSLILAVASLHHKVKLHHSRITKKCKVVIWLAQKVEITKNRVLQNRWNTMRLWNEMVEINRKTIKIVLRHWTTKMDITLVCKQPQSMTLTMSLILVLRILIS